MGMVLGAVSAVVFIAVAAALAFKYRQSGQTGFLWLAVPLVLFPLLGLPLDYWVKASVDGLQATEPHVMFPFTLVESGRMTLGALVSLLSRVGHLVWSAFLLVGILMLGQRHKSEQSA